MSGRPAESEPRLAQARERMVADQLRARGIADERVLDAMGRIPREWFIGDPYRRHAYDDEALPIEAGQTISQPYMVARMTELLAPRPGDRILEIGTGSGYQAAVLAALGARVTTIERHEDLAMSARERLADLGFGDLVDVRVGDGSLGAAGWSPVGRDHRHRRRTGYHPRLRDQLADGARLVIPVGPRDRQILTVVTRHGERVERAPGRCLRLRAAGRGGRLGSLTGA